MTTDYIVFWSEPRPNEGEYITDDPKKAQQALRRMRRMMADQVHLHKVTGTTEFPLNEAKPLEEECLTHACGD